MFHLFLFSFVSWRNFLKTINCVVGGKRVSDMWAGVSIGCRIFDTADGMGFYHIRWVLKYAMDGRFYLSLDGFPIAESQWSDTGCRF